MEHPFFRQHPDVGDGIINAGGDDAFSLLEFLVVQVHPIAHDTRIYCGSDFSGAGGLGSVTDGAGENGHGIGDGVGYSRESAA